MPGLQLQEILALTFLWRPGDRNSDFTRQIMDDGLLMRATTKRLDCFLRACTVGLATLILAASCGIPPSPTASPPTRTTIPATIAPATKTPTCLPTATATSTLMPFEAVMPPAAGLIKPEESILSFEFSQAALGREGEFLLVFDKEPHPSLPSGGEITLDILDFAGHREPLLRVSYEGQKEDLELDAVPPGDLPSSVALLELVESYQSKEFYLIDLTRIAIWGLRHGCDMLNGVASSDKYLIYSCFETPSEWYVLPIDAPDRPIVRSLAGATDDPLGSLPKWFLGDLVIFYPDASYQACAGEIQDWRPTCKELPFWLGPISPDGQWFEARAGEHEYLHPDQIGVLAAECLSIPGADCSPHLRAFPANVSPLGSSRFLGNSAWDPLSESIYYVVHINTFPRNNEPEESEIWRYDVATQRFEKLAGPMPGVLHFGEEWYMYQPPAPWSPDGRYVAMKEIGGGIYKLEVETGELSLLSEGGVLLGSVHLE